MYVTFLFLLSICLEASLRDESNGTKHFGLDEIEIVIMSITDFNHVIF